MTSHWVEYICFCAVAAHARAILIERKPGSVQLVIIKIEDGDLLAGDAGILEAVGDGLDQLEVSPDGAVAEGVHFDGDALRRVEQRQPARLWRLSARSAGDRAIDHLAEHSRSQCIAVPGSSVAGAHHAAFRVRMKLDNFRAAVRCFDGRGGEGGPLGWLGRGPVVAVAVAGPCNSGGWR